VSIDEFMLIKDNISMGYIPKVVDGFVVLDKKYENDEYKN
jgi:hypothetical protein